MTSETGRMGEDIASEFLRGKGYRIIDRNLREKFGEIDILARSKNGETIFVEVKTLVRSRWLLPEDHMNSSKISKLKKMAQMFSAKQDEKDAARGQRIDLIAIELPENWKEISDLTNIIKSCDIRHYENI